MLASENSNYTISANEEAKKQTDKEKTPTLLDLFYDGFLLLLTIKQGNVPQNADDIHKQITEILHKIDIAANKAHFLSDDLYSTKYAFCATADEIIFNHAPNIRDHWQRQPLQVSLFGDHLAGENFYKYLEDSRRLGAAKVHNLEVFYVCLLLGFQGKYLLEGRENLNYLVARIGEEIKYHRGKKNTSFSPHAVLNENISHTLHRNFSIPAIGIGLILLASGVFFGMKWYLEKQTKEQLQEFQNLIQAPQKTAELIISLP